MQAYNLPLCPSLCINVCVSVCVSASISPHPSLTRRSRMFAQVLAGGLRLEPAQLPPYIVYTY